MKPSSKYAVYKQRRDSDVWGWTCGTKHVCDQIWTKYILVQATSTVWLLPSNSFCTCSKLWVLLHRSFKCLYCWYLCLWPPSSHWHWFFHQVRRILLFIIIIITQIPGIPGQWLACPFGWSVTNCQSAVNVMHGFQIPCLQSSWILNPTPGQWWICSLQCMSCLDLKSHASNHPRC